MHVQDASASSLASQPTSLCRRRSHVLAARSLATTVTIGLVMATAAVLEPACHRLALVVAC
jgi:hypothetical protein